jgi:ATP-dependent RNA helicase DDX5/DBP2
MPQQRREEQLQSFRSGKVNVLIASDVAARGLHIKRIEYVINYDFPPSIEQYCHRIGRTGRDCPGAAYSLFTRNYAPLAKELMQLLEHCQQTVEKNLRELVADVDGSNVTMEAVSADGEEANQEETSQQEESERRVVYDVYL